MASTKSKATKAGKKKPQSKKVSKAKPAVKVKAKPVAKKTKSPVKAKTKKAAVKQVNSPVKAKVRGAVKATAKIKGKVKAKGEGKQKLLFRLLPHGADQQLIPVQGEIHPARIKEARKVENNFHHNEETALHQENQKARQAMANRKGAKRFFRSPGRR